MARSLQLYEPSSHEMARHSYDEIEKIASAIAKSGMFGIKDPAQAVVLCLLAEAEGVHPVTAARDYDIIGNRPAKKAEAMHRDFLRAGGTIKWNRLDDEVADATFSHPQGGTAHIVWDIQRAERAGLTGKTGGMWQKYPRQLLRSRCLSEGCKTVWPSATSGFYTPEETRDVIAAEQPPILITGNTGAGVVGPDTTLPLEQPIKTDELNEALVETASRYNWASDIAADFQHWLLDLCIKKGSVQSNLSELSPRATRSLLKALPAKADEFNRLTTIDHAFDDSPSTSSNPDLASNPDLTI